MAPIFQELEWTFRHDIAVFAGSQNNGKFHQRYANTRPANLVAPLATAHSERESRCPPAKACRDRHFPGAPIMSSTIKKNRHGGRRYGEEFGGKSCGARFCQISRFRCFRSAGLRAGSFIRRQINSAEQKQSVPVQLSDGAFRVVLRLMRLHVSAQHGVHACLITRAPASNQSMTLRSSRIVSSSFRGSGSGSTTVAVLNQSLSTIGLPRPDRRAQPVLFLRPSAHRPASSRSYPAGASSGYA